MTHPIKHSFKNEIKNTLNISIPLVASQLIYSLSNFIGTAFVARLSQEALAASILVSMVWFSLSVLFFGILNATSVLVAHQHGAKNAKAISEILGQSFLLGIIISACVLIIFSAMPFFLRWSQQPEVVLTLAYQYLFSMMWSIPALVLLIILEQFLAGIARTRIIMRISLLVVPLEIPLMYLLIFGKLGFPECGIAGIGYAFAISYTLTAIGMVYYLLKSKQFEHYAIFARLGTWNWPYLKELIRVGLPIGLMSAIEVSTFLVATFYIAQFGTTLLAAQQIVMQYLGFVITIAFAMSQAVTVRVGHAVGQVNMPVVHHAIYIGMLLNFILIALIALTFYLVPNLFLRLDIDIAAPTNAELVRDAAMLLSINGVFLLFENFRIILFGALRGLKDTKFPMIASLIGFWCVGLSAAYWFGFILHGEGNGVWWGLIVGVAISAIILLWRLRYLLKHVDLTKLAIINTE